MSLLYGSTDYAVSLSVGTPSNPTTAEGGETTCAPAAASNRIYVLVPAGQLHFGFVNDDKTRYMVGGTSYGTRTTKRRQSVQFTGIVVNSDTSVLHSYNHVQDFIMDNLGSVMYVIVKDAAGYRASFTDTTTQKFCLGGLVRSYRATMLRTHVLLDLTFEEAWT